MGVNIALIINFAFVGILIIGFLIGLWRGLKKATVNLAFSIVGIIIAFFITPIITNSILAINITINGVKQSISDFIISNISSNPDIALMIEANPNFAIIIDNLPKAFASTIVFILLTLAIEFIIYFIYKIIAVLFLKNKAGQKKHRILGGTVGTVRAFLLSIFALMPIASLVGLADRINQTDDIYIETVIAEEYHGESTPSEGLLDKLVGNKQVSKTISSVNNSSVVCVVGSVFGLDDAMFDYLSSFKIENERVHIRQEISTYADVANIFLQLKDGHNKFSAINFDKFESCVDKVVESKLFTKFVSDILSDIIINYKEYSFTQALSEYNEIFDEIGERLNNVKTTSEYFSNDIKQIFYAFKNLAENGTLDNIDTITTDNVFDSIMYLVSEENFSSTQKAMENIFSMNLIRDSISSVTKTLLENVMEGLDEIKANTENFNEETWKNLSSQFSNLLKDASKALEVIDIKDIISNPAGIIDPTNDTSLTQALTLVGGLIDDIREIEILKNSEGNSIIDSLLSKNNLILPENEVYDLQGEVVEINSYTKMFEFISSSIEEIKRMDFNKFLQNGVDVKEILILLAKESKKQTQPELYLNKILLPLSQVPFTEKLIFDDILFKIEENNVIDFRILNNYQTRKHDLKYINQLIIALSNNYEAEKTILDALLESDVPADILLQDNLELDTILKPVLYAHSTQGLRVALFDAIDSISNSLGKEGKFDRENVVLIEGDENDQADSICEALKSLVKLYRNIKDIEESLGQAEKIDIKDIDIENVGEFIYQIKDSTVFESVLDAVSEKVEENIPQEFKQDFNTLLEQTGAKNLKEYIAKEDISNFVDNFKTFFGQNKG